MIYSIASTYLVANIVEYTQLTAYSVLSFTIDSYSRYNHNKDND